MAERTTDVAAAPLSIELAASGDHSAFAEFYDEVAPAVYGTTLRVVRNPAIAEEITQEVFLELWRQAPRYDRSKGTPKAWAATIAHRRAVDRVRAEQSARDREDADARTIVSPHDEVADEVADTLDRRSVSAALSVLSEPQREAIRLAYYDGHTYREVASLLGVPEGTVKTRIRDGLARLRGAIGGSS